MQVPLEWTPKTTLEERVVSKVTFKSKCYSAFQFRPLHSDPLNSTVLWHKHSTWLLSGPLLELPLSLSVSIHRPVCLSLPL